MKKLLFLFAAASLFFSSCKKTDDRIFKESFDERINASMAKYQSVLTSAPNGWKALITTNNGNGGTYSFYMKFDNANRVTMVSDFDTSFAVTPKTSGYRIRQQQQPTLIFDTYSYVHVLADPNENAVIYSNVNGGSVGQGLLSDFEFIIRPDGLGTDTLKLTGKINGARLVMTKATAAEENIFLNGQWVLLESYLSKRLLTYYKRISIGGKEYDLSIDPSSKTISFQWIDDGVVKKHTTAYYSTLEGIVLSNPLPAGAGSISKINIVEWDAANATLSVKVGSQNTTITETIFPVEGALQINAAEEWRNFAIDNQNTYWISLSGFHVDGVDDAFNIQALASRGNTYYYLIYWPEYEPGVDLFAPIFLNASQTGLTLLYGAASDMQSPTPEGVTKFSSPFNNGNYPNQPSNAARKTRNLFFQPAGFYFVKVNDRKYDMVSALNGRAWLRWEF